MALPGNTSVILQSLGYVPVVDFVCRKNTAGTVFLTWLHADPEPSEAAILAQGASQAFADWQAENGGDAALTLRKRAREALDASDQNGALIRAFALVVLDEVNALRAAAVPALPARTEAQLKNAVRAKIAAGDADNGQAPGGRR